MGKTLTFLALAHRRQKHPHARGEDINLLGVGTSKTETPPRTWGRRRSFTSSMLSVRNTPTHVGKTPSLDEIVCAYQKHPHARGEDRAVVVVWFPVLETPPRTWGRPIQSFTVVSCNRNTPTHVGKTADEQIEIQAGQKHPHARGEDAARTA